MTTVFAPAAPAAPVAPAAPALDALGTLARWSDHPSAFLALNRGTEHFREPGLEGLVAYRRCGGWLFQLGGPFGPEGERRALLEAFRAFARARGQRICALQLRPEDATLYQAAGFRVNQLGTSFSLGLDGFELRGSRFMQLRNKLSKAKREGVTVAELGRDGPVAADVEPELAAITDAWLASKGRGKKLLEFLVGERGGPHEGPRRTFVARREGRVLAFVTYVPAWGRNPGLMHDLSRRAPDAPPGTLELVNATAIERLRAEGVPWLHFGLTPFVGLEPATDAFPGRSHAVSWLLGQLAVRGAAVYPAQTQAAYKKKWAPGLLVPEYLAFEGRFRLGCLVRLLQLTRSI